MKEIMKKLALIIALAMVVVGFAACGGGDDTAKDTPQETAANKNAEETQEEPQGEAMTGQILVVTREEGSGTRGAFVEITGVETEEGDQTTLDANVSQGTNEVITFVSGADAAIGYISLGSLNETVRAVPIEGVEATTENIIAGTYPISRPFNICYQKGTENPLRDDFIHFIFSDKGAAIIEEAKFIPLSEEPYTPAEGLSGKLVIQGSTSVNPVMEALAEAYQNEHADVVIEIEATGSGAGITAANEGNADIGMASRELKPEELENLDAVAIAQDGIAVILNNNNPTASLTVEQVRQIFTGEITDWSEIK